MYDADAIFWRVVEGNNIVEIRPYFVKFLEELVDDAYEPVRGLISQGTNWCPWGS